MDQIFPGEAPWAAGYTFIRLLGSGGTAQAWLTHDSQGKQRVLKCFAPADDADPAADLQCAAALRREVRILGNLRHDHLLIVSDVTPLAGEWEGGQALVCEYAAGGSMAGVLAARGAVTVGELVTVLTPLFQALEYLHSRGVVHGDISAGNVLFTAEGKPLLSDLGLSRMVGERPRAEVIGTDGYVDPALFSPVPAGGADRTLSSGMAADVYALCALGWHALGGAPSRGKESGAIEVGMSGAGLAGTTGQLPINAPPQLVMALRSGLDPDPARRPSAAQLAQMVYRGAVAEPIDLMASVHASVLPQLPTRKQIRSTSSNRASAGAIQVPSPVIQKAPLRVAAVQPTTGDAADVAPIDAPRAEASGRPRGRRAAPKPAKRLRARKEPARRSMRSMKGRWRWSMLVGSLSLVTAAGVLAVLIGVAGPGPSAQQAGGSRTGSTHSTTSLGTPPGAAPGAVPAEVEAAASSPDPLVAVKALVWFRAEAFRTGTAELLGRVNAPGSAAEAADQQSMAPLVAHRHALAGFSMTLGSAAASTNRSPGAEAPSVASGSSSMVAVEVELSAFREMSQDGAVIAEHPQIQRQSLEFLLVQINSQWRIQRVFAH
ncbi:serine/threonine-protein kinase [Psychromicrobium xiongbiense]|uniref:serine/threonine-protein kinase n=1 Tax=Psychromicrobium xiongbiense TaxID=3051184 RepID=UPI002554F5B8|nr:serine/threonine-protein kinase [Psychromicrobium sp. YIM S02556]